MKFSLSTKVSGLGSGFYFDDDKNAPADCVKVTNHDAQTAQNLPPEQDYSFDNKGQLTIFNKE